MDFCVNVCWSGRWVDKISDWNPSTHVPFLHASVLRWNTNEARIWKKFIKWTILFFIVQILLPHWIRNTLLSGWCCSLFDYSTCLFDTQRHTNQPTSLSDDLEPNIVRHDCDWKLLMERFVYLSLKHFLHPNIAIDIKFHRRTSVKCAFKQSDINIWFPKVFLFPLILFALCFPSPVNHSSPPLSLSLTHFSFIGSENCFNF